MESGAPSVAAVLGTFAVNAGLAWMIGFAVMTTWVRGRPFAWARRSVDGLVTASSLTLVALAFDLWRRSAEAVGVPLFAAGDATMTMLSATHYGHAWMVGVVCVITIAAAARFGLVGHRRSTTIAWIVGFGALVYTRSIVSHAGSDGDLSLAVAVDSIHLVGVSLWAGVVWVTACVMRPSRDGMSTGAESWLRTLSTIATIALTAILLTGFVNAWRATAGSISALPGSTYGTVLLAKVALVVCAAGLGGINRWVFLPRLPATLLAHRAFATILRIEFGVLAIVSLLAAALGNLEPPGSM